MLGPRLAGVILGQAESLLWLGGVLIYPGQGILESFL